MDIEKIERTIRTTLWFAGAAVVLAIGCYVYWFYFKLGRDFSPDPDAWGQLGDYIGGLLNPIVAVCTFYWLTQSVRLQKTELSDTRVALVKSQIAQEKQARIALLAARIDSINIRLTLLSGELSYRRQKRHLYIELANHGNTIRPVISEYGRTVHPIEIIKGEAERIEFLEQQQFSLTDQLNEVLRAAEKESL